MITQKKDQTHQFSTPMMQQYHRIKQQYQDCLLFYRLGDFYELFLKDAEIGSEILDIVLTNRPRGKDGNIPMAGVPFHAADSYISKLIKAGQKIAICEQISEPDGKGIVERKVVRVITPGTLLDEKTLQKKENNFLFSFTLHKKNLGLAAVDVSTGQFFYHQTKSDHQHTELLHQVTHLNPRECVLSPALYNQPKILKLLQTFSDLNVYCFHEWDEATTNAEKRLKEHFEVSSLKSFGIDKQQYAQKAAVALLSYLEKTQKKTPKHITSIQPFTSKNQLILDRSAIVNLELLSTIRNGQKQGSLIALIDKTKTPMGARLLRQWMLKPLSKKRRIESRLDLVAYFFSHRQLRQEIRQVLASIRDIERTFSRISLGIGNPRDLIQLQTSLVTCVTIFEKLDTFYISERNNKDSNQHLHTLLLPSQKVIKDIQKLITTIKTQLIPDPPIDPKQGGLIKPNILKKLDTINNTIQKSKNWIKNLEETEKKKTQITTLKVKYNKVFGYYIEVSKSHLEKVPQSYQRKQTLVNSERFTTPELKKHEEIILAHQEIGQKIEYQLFLKLIEQVIQFTESIQQTSSCIAHIDCFTNLAKVAEQYDYVKPTINKKGVISITQGRHPVLEQMASEQHFVPNDVMLNTDDHQLLIITGPNMAGKSVLMRQTALITLLAHMGSFVPAENATISLTDRIFVRSGASDMITEGLSTFMVEMVETAHILKQATSDSLIIMDEIGRGTSTYDGISIAWAVAESLVSTDSLTPKTLFATHYHELQTLADSYPKKIKNYSMAIHHDQDKPIFLYTLVNKPASRSFGIAVAKLAGIPQSVIQRSTYLLQKSYLKNHQPPINPSKNHPKENNKEKSFQTMDSNIATIIQQLKTTDINHITPLEALKLLHTLQMKL